MKQTLYILAVALLLTSCSLGKVTVSTTVPGNVSQGKNDSERYILTYYPMAVEQMELHGIPASITLAQALLEGGAGRSDLVKNANNHFGVKADKRWNGKTYSKWDNGKLCKFRVYKNTRESFEDHSRFLLSNSRYDFLFELRRDDYKGWARGLKKAGYAEDREYASKLIGIIERYNLQQYDSYKKNRRTRIVEVNVEADAMVSLAKPEGRGLARSYNQRGYHELLKKNGLICTIASAGDTFESLAAELNVSRRKIRKYNDLYKKYIIKEGDIIYLEKKRNKAKREHKFHTTEQGESLYLISQMYGIKLKKLYKMNPMYKEYANLKVGDIIRLR